MAKTVHKYLAIMHNGDASDSPSSLVRQTVCSDPPIIKIEGCSKAGGWQQDNSLYKYFMGMSEEGHSISQKKAEKILSKWRKNWET